MSDSQLTETPRAGEADAQRASSAEQQFLADVFASIQDGISVLDKDLVILEVNHAMEKWYAHAVPLRGKKCYEAYHGRTAPCEVCPTRKALETGESAFEIVPLRGRDGKITGWLDLYAFPLRDMGTGAVKGVIEYVRDITARRRAEEVLGFHYRVLESLSEAVSAAEEDGTIVFTNAAFDRMFGYAPGEVVGTRVSMLTAYPPEETRVRMNEVVGQLKTDGRWAGELLNRRKDGGTFATRTVITLLEMSGRKYMVSVREDVTEQRKAAEALEKSEVFRRQVFDSVNDMIVVHDIETGRILDANDRWLNQMKISLDAARGKGLEIYDRGAAPYAIDDIRRWIDRVLREGPQVFEWPGKTIDGRQRWVETSMRKAAVQGRDCLLAVVRDITERKETAEALRESEERSRLLTDATFEGIMISDGGVVLEANQALAEMFGCERSELIGRDLVDRAAPESRVVIREKIQNKNDKPYEVKGIRKDGSVIDTEVVATVCRYRGKEARVVALRDITARKKAEEALKTTQFAVDHMAEAVYWIIPDGRIIYVNEAACRTLGYSREELLGKTIFDINPDTVPETWGEVWRRSREQVSFIIETQHRKKSGETFSAEVHGSIFAFGGREISFTSVRDITERKAAEEALREAHDEMEKRVRERTLDIVATNKRLNAEIVEHWTTENALRDSEARWRTMFEGAPDIIFTTDLEGRIAYVSRAPMGYSIEETIGRSIFDYSPPEYRAEVRRRFDDVVRTGEIGNAETPAVRRNDGATAWYAAQIGPIRRGRKIVGAMFIARDISKQKRLEQEILDISEREQRRLGRDLHDDLGQQLTGIAYMARALEQKLACESSLAAAEASRIAELVQRAIRQTSGLAQGLYPVRLETNDLVAALAALAADTEALAGVACRFRCPAPIRMADPSAATHLYRIAQEAVHNAVKHGHPARVDIAIECGDERVVMTVRDDGAGIPGELEPGRQGMGLHIMAYRARMIGAELDIRRAEGGGTAVTCSFSRQITKPHGGGRSEVRR
jgi:PAS domain S-box-containing protein